MAECQILVSKPLHWNINSVDKNMDYGNYADTAIEKSNILVPALLGTAMAGILMGKVFDSSGYTFFTVAPSIVLLLCLWIPYLQRKASSLKQ